MKQEKLLPASFIPINMPENQSLLLGKIRNRFGKISRRDSRQSKWCPGWESNPQDLRRKILSLLRLPIPPPGRATGKMVHLKGVEPLTSRFVVWRSIQLSYKCANERENKQRFARQRKREVRAKYSLRTAPFHHPATPVRPP